MRPAIEDDAEAVRTLRGLLGDVTPSFQLDPLHDLVAQVEEDVVGWIRVTFGESLHEIGGLGAWIQSIAVLPSFRRHRIGEELVQAAEAQALEAGDRVIACQPLDDRSAAFFEELGFADHTLPGLEAFWKKELSQ